MLNRYRDAFKSYQRHDVRYVVVGGIASILHGVPRATFGLDILVEATSHNVEHLLAALLEAGLATASMTTVDALLANEITVFKDRVRIDVLLRVPGVTFEDAWARRLTLSYQGQDFFVLSRDDLIASKRAAGRPVDLEDVRLLELPDADDAARPE